MVTLSAILQALPKLIALIQFFAGMVRDAEQRGLGRAEAIAEAADTVQRDVATAREAEHKAKADHAAHPNDDGGFDTEFQRKD